MAQGLTRRQRAIYEFIVEAVEDQGYPPSLMEIARAFGLSSASGIADHLNAIERKGFIRRRRGISRGIELTRIDMVRSSRRQRVVRLPVVGTVPSDEGLQPPESASGHVHVDERLAGSDAVVVRNRLDGLEELGILPGDLLVVADGEPARGDLVVARRGRRTTLVAIERSVGRHDDLTEIEGRSLDPVGRVVAVLRSLEDDRPTRRASTKRATSSKTTTARGKR